MTLWWITMVDHEGKGSRNAAEMVDHDGSLVDHDGSLVDHDGAWVD